MVIYQEDYAGHRMGICANDEVLLLLISVHGLFAPKPGEAFNRDQAARLGRILTTWAETGELKDE